MATPPDAVSPATHGVTGAPEVELGEIVGVFGVRGEVKLFLHNPGSTLLARPREVTLVGPDGSRRVVRLSARGGAGKRIIGRVPEITDPDVAKTLVGWRVVIPEAALPKPGRDEWYVKDLVGLRVLHGDAEIGRVVEVHQSGPTDILEIGEGAEAQFVPLLRQWLEGVDLAAGVLRLRDGALEP